MEEAGTCTLIALSRASVHRLRGTGGGQICRKYLVCDERGNLMHDITEVVNINNKI